jgi:hypothetical protein
MVKIFFTFVFYRNLLQSSRKSSGSLMSAYFYPNGGSVLVMSTELKGFMSLIY